MQEFSLQLSRLRKLFSYHSTDSPETACSTFSPYRGYTEAVRSAWNRNGNAVPKKR
ncbi:hypothetical protein IGI04_003129 [Brassica rapa subsp. trilocularis]|uniref:Uncharacterized protein n=1 Tax=Brassica rapa subsp. trilocularis TaxID=1813537 RepID=A0ABQ7NXJ1_BRACM|nr:hypothetical protein IGI04_003129 [Brassica rapa subsp. trilocularis]